MKIKLLFVVGVVALTATILLSSSYFFAIPFKLINEGKTLDSFNGIEVYYNGSVDHIESRNVTKDGYNVGLKWQCVEFVKRYYLDIYDHKMPDSYGNAVDFFDPQIGDGKMNPSRGLLQFSNPSKFDVQVGDVLVFSGGYGHVAIVSEVHNNHIQIIQQNVGINTREELYKFEQNGVFSIRNNMVLGWLRIP